MNALQFARLIVSAQQNVVEYQHGATICPVCRELGLPPGKTTVTCTTKDVRYLTCDQCLSTFRAIGDERPKKIKEVVKTPEPASEPIGESPDNTDNIIIKQHNKTVKKKEKVTDGNKKRNRSRSGDVSCGT